MGCLPGQVVPHGNLERGFKKVSPPLWPPIQCSGPRPSGIASCHLTSFLPVGVLANSPLSGVLHRWRKASYCLFCIGYLESLGLSSSWVTLLIFPAVGAEGAGTIAHWPLEAERPFQIPDCACVMGPQTTPSLSQLPSGPAPIALGDLGPPPGSLLLQSSPHLVLSLDC